MCSKRKRFRADANSIVGKSTIRFVTLLFITAIRVCTYLTCIGFVMQVKAHEDMSDVEFNQYVLTTLNQMRSLIAQLEESQQHMEGMVAGNAKLNHLNHHEQIERLRMGANGDISDILIALRQLKVSLSCSFVCPVIFCDAHRQLARSLPRMMCLGGMRPLSRRYFIHTLSICSQTG